MTSTESARIIDEVIRSYRPHAVHYDDVPIEWLAEPSLKVVSGYRHWRNEPATEKQLAYLRVLGHRATALMTKGEACDLIEQLKA